MHKQKKKQQKLYSIDCNESIEILPTSAQSKQRNDQCEEKATKTCTRQFCCVFRHIRMQRTHNDEGEKCEVKRRQWVAAVAAVAVAVAVAVTAATKMPNTRNYHVIVLSK